jgi:hypothetical protein|tara:strand:+ start:773 stop:1006 length:234 start_codon:yes stop_codon:yes gene_type:complete
MKKNNKVCYNTLMRQLNSMDKQICKIKEQIRQLKSCFVANDDEEVCLDEIEADRAALEAINDICLESLLDIEPKGDA